MPKESFIDFLNGAGDKPYRQLIEHYIKKMPTQVLQKEVLEIISSQPIGVRPMYEQYIDVVNNEFGYDRNFWENATCRQAFKIIIDIAIQILPVGDSISSIEDALKPQNDKLVFDLFLMPSLSVAYSASTQRKQRKLMGIRKGLLG